MYKCATYKNSHVTEFISVCGSDCTECHLNGAGKCDSGKCGDGFGLDALDNTCKGKATRNSYYVLQSFKQWKTAYWNYDWTDSTC